VLSGEEGWEDFGNLKFDSLKKYRPFKYEIPKYDTTARVIYRLKAYEIEHAFQSWISLFVEITGSNVIAIDGKMASMARKIKWQDYMMNIAAPC